ncbi:TrmB family transcriptional regulator [Candidatus Neomarinimicrobiota bacterium]
MKTTEELLMGIGFNKLESTIYLMLLQESKATGYRIAQLIGKPVSNTYKALSTLQKKSAIIVDESKKPKEWIPVPIEEYFDVLEQNLNTNRTVLKSQLKKYSIKSPKEGIFQLDEIEQVIEKGKKLIREANHTIMADLFPNTIEFFKDELEEKASKGIKVFVKTYETVDLKGCNVVVPNSEYRQIEWNCDWCNIIVDNSEFLIAFLEKDQEGVLQAIWSKSSYLNLILVSGYLHEFILGQISNQIFSKKPLETIILELRDLYGSYMYNTELKDSYSHLLSEIKESNI